jgi:hypothetical protein
MYFNALRNLSVAEPDPAAGSFLPGGKICRGWNAKSGAVIASAECGLY